MAAQADASYLFESLKNILSLIKESNFSIAQKILLNLQPCTELLTIETRTDATLQIQLIINHLYDIIINYASTKGTLSCEPHYPGLFFTFLFLYWVKPVPELKEKIAASSRMGFIYSALKCIPLDSQAVYSREVHLIFYRIFSDSYYRLLVMSSYINIDFFTSQDKLLLASIEDWVYYESGRTVWCRYEGDIIHKGSPTRSQIFSSCFQEVFLLCILRF